MDWLSLISAAVKIVSALIQWAERNQLITSAQKSFLADQLVEQAHAVDRGLQARLAQRLHDAGGVSDDEPDPFRRD